jgi:UV DNA damage endonuclease
MVQLFFLENDEVVPRELIPTIRNRIRLGLCCINQTLRDAKPSIYCNRTMIRRTFSVDRAKELALQNVRDIVPILEWNHKHNIRHLRLSSDMFPHYTDTETEPYDMKFAYDALKSAGETANRLQHRITMHPGQYNQVGAKDKSVWEKTVKELSMHAEILDNMNIDNNGILCVHGGGVYGDKEATIRRWIEQFADLPKSVRNRLAIENCEKCYSVEDCLYIANECGIPMIYDNLHYDCFPHYNSGIKQKGIHHLMDDIIYTWTRDNRTPLFHLSQQSDDKSYVGAHADYFTNRIPDEMLFVPFIYDVDLDIELEVKAKEKAIFQVMNRYSCIF